MQEQFADRRAAGRALAVRLAQMQLPDPLVIALPRGGVPVGYEVARALAAPLDLVFVRKLGAPGHSEYAIGAITDGDEPRMVLDRAAAAHVGANTAHIEAVRAAGLAEIARQRKAYGLSKPMPRKGRSVILVDDGIATGSTAKVALQAIAASHPERVVLAVPVAPADAIEELGHYCDEVVCLATPRPFFAVGEHYRDFGETSDEEVRRLLADADGARASIQG